MSSKKRSSTKTRERQSARERIAAARAAEKRRERMRWLITFSVTGVVVAALAVGALLVINRPYALSLFDHASLLIGMGISMLVGVLWIRKIVNFEA